MAAGVQTIPGSPVFTKPAGLYMQFPLPICNRLLYKRTAIFRVKCRTEQGGQGGLAGSGQNNKSNPSRQLAPKPADKGSNEQQTGGAEAGGAAKPPGKLKSMALSNNFSDVTTAGGPSLARTNELLAMIAVTRMMGAEQANAAHFMTCDAGELWNGRFAMLGIGCQ